MILYLFSLGLESLNVLLLCLDFIDKGFVLGVSELGGSSFVHEVVEFLFWFRAVKHAYSNRKMINMISSSKEFMEYYKSKGE